MKKLKVNLPSVILLIILTLIAQLFSSVSFPKITRAQALKYDVVVIGSEIQGVLLAKAARDLGLNVIILDPRTKPGGELIQGEMLVLDKPNDKQGRSLVQGEFKKLFNGYENGTIRKAVDFERYYQKMIKGIPMKSGIVIDDIDIAAIKKDKSVKSLTYHTKDGTKFTIQAEYWVENTDFNALTGKLDVQRIPGMESLYKGKKPDYMTATFMLKFKNIDWAKLHQSTIDEYPLANLEKKYGPNTYVDWNYATGYSNLMNTYKSQDRQLKLRGLNCTNQKDGEVIINALLIYDVDPSDPKSVQSAISKGKAEAPYIQKFLRKTIPGFAKAELNGFPEYLYIRDYNRFETEYVLDYPDVMSSKMFWDNVSVGGYPVDLQGTRAMPLGMGFGKPDRYGIPLRSFTLKSYDNVLVAGKNIGATIKAYGSARIMSTTALAAQTIGIILGRELKQNKRLNELTKEDFKRIHKYLKKDYGISIAQ
ncbi:FAD-dependent oxidoreductase [Paenibacillus segetis]|uniref:FAD dependent oxidoreductase n=1 Tax=Paenibacillus segetis TaxID=1325360 RepID=A0ABQ1YPC0_9BACL|nr:FAD-dependent oxidoreductase [Paenibacillus segetis]GGH31926.1 hypothetical protein GCM10008013_36000 [Paenibacillus segetis]